MSQTTAIIQYLEDGNRLTPLLALRLFGCMRLSARIYDLREMGYGIKTKLVTRRDKTYAEYSL
jgi:hypothetical protein